MKSSIKKGLALVVANAHYRSQPKLMSCRKDGMDMQFILENLGFDVMVAFDTTRTVLYKKIEDFLRVADLYSTVLVYYSGHGVQIDGENYIVPIDCTYISTKAIFIGNYLVGINAFTDYMNAHPEKVNIMILDACRTTLPFSKDMIGTGLAEVNAGSGSIIAFATSPNSAALCPLDESENGYYTQCLLRHIAHPNIKIEEMFKSVRRDVLEKTAGAQTPWESTSLNSDFYFSSMTQDEIDERIYQSVRNHYCAETLIMLSIAYGYSVSSVMRIYERQKSEKPGGIYIASETDLEQFILEHILGLGFELNNYRWVYRGIPICMGEFYHDYSKPIEKKAI